MRVGGPRYGRMSRTRPGTSATGSRRRSRFPRTTLLGCGVVPVVLIALTVALLGTVGAAVAQPGPYTSEVDFDRPGADYDGFEQQGPWQGPSVCRDACFAAPRCRSFTYVRPGVEGPRGRCRLKDKVPSPVESRCCISGVKGGRPAEPAVATMPLELEWRGWTADWSRQHYRLALALPAPAELVHVALGTADDPAGLVEFQESSPPEPREPECSSRRPDSLRVEVDGRQLSPSSDGSLGRFSGKVELDLFPEDRGQGWRRDGWILVEVELGNGRRPRRWIRLTQPDGTLVGTWQMHCASSSPDAFEPLTLSGRLIMRVSGDGKISGVLGRLPLTGSLEPSGSASGSGGSGSETITWAGTISTAKSKKPLSGKGTFDPRGWEPTCQQGWWSSE